MNTFQLFRKDRDPTCTGHSRGGGVLLAIKRDIVATLCDLPIKNNILDQICVRITVYDNVSFYIFVSYIPPNSEFYIYKLHIDNIVGIQSTLSPNDQLCILGDFNFCNVRWSSDLNINNYLTPSSYTSQSECYFLDYIYGLNLIQINTFRNSLGKLLDLVFISNNINFSCGICQTSFLPCDKHHVPLEISLDFYRFSRVKLSSKSLLLNFRRANYLNINDSLSTIDWVSLFENKSVNRCYELFTNMVKHISAPFIPLKKLAANKAPWKNPSFMKLRNLRNRYHKKFSKSGSPVHGIRLKSLNRQLYRLSKQLHSDYIRKVEVNVKRNPKFFWSFIKSKKSCYDLPSSLHLDDINASDLDDIVNLFVEFFKSNFSESYINDTVPDFNYIASKINLGSLTLEDSDILLAINNLNGSCSIDNDGFSPFFIKMCASTFCVPLRIIFNLSLKLGIFPDMLKVTYISPFFKKGAKDNIRNYRPIAKLPTVSKIFETIIKTKLSFIVKNVICPSQHGFVNNRSTVTNLAVFSKYCYDSFLINSQIDVIYTDFSKAFDKVSHKLLIAKLSALGFHSAFLKWVESYMTNRLCFVSIDGHISDPFIPTSGVPQGSILGPLFFILFINDIGQFFNHVRFLLFADDLKLFTRVNSLADMSLLQADIDSLVAWCKMNKLYLNVDKCFHMSITKLRNIFSSNYFIGNSNLTKVSHFTDLGVVFDSDFAFKQHLDYIIPKAYSAWGFIRRNSVGFNDPFTIKLLFCSLVRSILEYAAFIWNPFVTSHSSRIERVQRVFTKFALRPTFYNNSLRPEYDTRCLLLGIKSLESRRLYLSLMFVHGVISGGVDCPDLLKSICFAVPPRFLRQTPMFTIPLHRTTYSMNEPIVRCLNIFNKLSLNSNIDFSLSKSAFSTELLKLL